MTDRPIEEGAPGIDVVRQLMPDLMRALERALLDAYLAGVDTHPKPGSPYTPNQTEKES